MTNIILVDDHKVFLQGVEMLLSRVPDFEVIGIFSEGLEMMRFLAEKQRPDVLLLDIDMPTINGVKLAETVINQYPQVKVIMLSTYLEEEFLSQLMESGISGYLLKSTGFPELKAAISKVAAGGFAFSPEVMEMIVTRFNSKPKARKAALQDKDNLLSAREQELIRLIAEEYTMKEIAEKLYLSEHTVKTHRKNIMAKLEVKNTAGLIKKAFILGMIDI